MLPWVEIPPFVKKYAKGYQDLFSPEQFEHFRRSLTGLLVSENKTIQALELPLLEEVAEEAEV
jgi:hypothetical protein